MTFFLPIGRRSFLLSWRLVEALCVPVAFERVVWVGRQGSGVWRGRRTERGMQLAFGWRMACGRYVVCAGQFPARKRLAGTTNADMSFLWDGFGLQNGTHGR